MSQKALTHLALVTTFVLAFFAVTASAQPVTRFTTHQADGLTAELTFVAAPLKSMESLPFTLQIQGADQIPLEHLQLTCSLSMPAMAMPPNQPKVTGDGPEYAGYAVFTMAGAWQATFLGTDSSGKNIELIFDIPDVKMK